MDFKNFMSAITQLAEEKEIPKKKIIEVIETAIAAAYKKEYGERGQIIRAEMDPKTGLLQFYQIKIVMDDSMIIPEDEIEENREKRKDDKKNDEEDKRVRFNSERHVMIENAIKDDENINPGDELKTLLEEKSDFGRIAAQTAKQVILQKIKEVERDMVLGEFKSKEHEIVSGVIQRIEGTNIFIDIGKTLGILSREEQVPREIYRPGQRLKLYILKVEETSRGPMIFLSRAFPKLVVKLFELEAPEVSTGSVEIKAIAREAGSRSKVAVSSEEEGIDPIGAVVGQKGTRVSAVISELNGEKIDVIEYSPESEKFIANSLAPAKVIDVKVIDKNRVLVTVPDDQLSLAIGKDGQNVRLAAKLTGWKIDVKGLESEEVEETAEPDDLEKDESSFSENSDNNESKEKELKEKQN
jgi:transcription termination/antitermination protein NusA